MRRILLTLAKIFAVIAAAFLLCGSARAEGSGEYGDINSALSDAVPVSYTHLTLPTICSV